MSIRSTTPLFEPEAIHYDSWYHTQELQCTGHHSFHKPYASGTNYMMEVWWKHTTQTASRLSCPGQLSSKFKITNVFILLICTVHRRHPTQKCENTLLVMHYTRKKKNLNFITSSTCQHSSESKDNLLLVNLNTATNSFIRNFLVFGMIIG